MEGRRLHLVVLEDHADPAAVQGHLVPPEELEVLPGKKYTAPWVGCRRRRIRASRVDFPAPEWPTT